MAHHSATIKSIRQNKKRKENNIFRKSQIKNAIKVVISNISNGEKDEANASLSLVQSKLAKGIKAGVVKKTTAARKISRLNTAIKAIAK